MGRRDYGTGSVYPDKTRGEGYWFLVLEDGWTERGTRKRTKRRFKGTRTAALRAMRQLQMAGPAPVASAATVKSYSDHWLEQIADTVRPSTFRTHRAAVRKWIVPAIGNRKLTSLSPGDLRTVDRRGRDAGLADSSVLRNRAVLATMLRAAIEDRHKVDPGLLTIRRPDKGEAARPAIPVDDARKILTAAASRANRSRWIAAFRYGLRPAEALGLTWANIGEDRIVIEWQLKALPYRTRFDRSSGFRVPAGYTAVQLEGAMHLVRPKTKSGRRVVPLLPDLAEELKRWKLYCNHPHDLVWSDGTHDADKRDREEWRALCAEAGVPAFDLYSARHTAATEMRQAGIDDQAITAAMGHASILSTLPYLHANTTRNLDGFAQQALTIGGSAESVPPAAGTPPGTAR